MFHQPMTLEEADKYRYGVWSGNPRGTAYDPYCCAAEISNKYISRQCSHKNGKGPDGLYCGIHAKKVTKEMKP